jgi:hypothetical protein
MLEHARMLHLFSAHGSERDLRASTRTGIWPTGALFMNKISCWIVRGSIAAVALLAFPILAQA